MNRWRPALLVATAVLVALLLAVVSRWPSGAGESSGAASLKEGRRDGSGAGGPLTTAPGVRGGSAGATPDVSRGTVIDEGSRAPISGASIIVREGTPWEPGGVLAETVSDSSGRFELPCGEWRFLVVRAAGYEASPRRLQCLDGWFLELSSGVRVDGIVVAASGKRPIPGARVFCARWALQAIDESVTDGDGTFSLSSCGAGELTLVASHPQTAPGTKDLGKLEPGARRTGVVVELADGRTLVGRVVDAESNPVPLADVVALERGELARPAATKTDLEGRFALGVGLGPQLVAGFVRDGRAGQVNVPAGADVPEGLEIWLPSWGSIRGRLTGADPAGGRVLAYRERFANFERAADAADVRDGYHNRTISPGFRFARVAKVDGDRFVVENVEPARYHLRAETATAKGEGTFAHDDPDIRIHLEETGGLAFKVTWDDGTPANGEVRVVCDSLVTGATVAKGVGESSSQVPVGDCRAMFFPDSGPIPDPTSVAAAPGDNEIDWRIARATVLVEGRVVGAGDAPLEGAAVSIAIENPGVWAGSEPGDAEYRGTTTDAEGRFSLVVSSLDAPLFVYREGYVSTTVLARDAQLIRLAPGEARPVVEKKPKPKPMPKPEPKRRPGGREDLQSSL